MNYISHGVRYEVALEPMATALERTLPRARRAGVRGARDDAALLATSLATRLRDTRALPGRFDDLRETEMLVVRPVARRSVSHNTLTIATTTVAVEGARPSDVAWAQNQGATVVEEGPEGKILLKVPGEGRNAVARAFVLAEELQARGVGAAHPNFVRALRRVPLGAGLAAQRHWAHRMIGVADAWATTRGRKDITVAVLDDGVDTAHPDLAAAVVRQSDFVGDNGDSAMPRSRDNHGTACAGIVLSRNAVCPGVAPTVSLMAARVAIGDDRDPDQWLMDDFRTAVAIDWCWREGADVLSNSWALGLPADVITRAFGRARTLGRNGLGAVIVAAAGNSESAVEYPATISGVLAVGASNQFDERKTRESRDGEKWGSCFGSTMALLAPGVMICTTDIAGPAGDGPGDTVETFNGTSAAAPHVAGAAALILSVAPGLRAAQVRQIILDTAHKFPGQTEWTEELGHGRLDVAAAVAATADSPPASPTMVGAMAMGLAPAPAPRRTRTRAAAAPRRRPRQPARPRS